MPSQHHCHPTLLLPAPPSDGEWNDRPVEVVGTLSGWGTTKKHIEAAGKAYELLIRGMWRRPGNDGDDGDDDDDGEDGDGGTMGDEGDETMEEDMREKMEGKRLQRNRKHREDYYALLGLGRVRWKATKDQLKRGYRKACLEYHPDKNMTADGRPDDTMFKAVQRAWATLSDDRKRRFYDSEDMVDDRIPSAAEASTIEDDEDFFEIFAPVFARNARWSSSRHVPELGDADTPWEEVDRFYRFWYAFKSWREFPEAVEYDTEQAESREERRWMEKMNQKAVNVKKREERKRIRTLVDRAYRKDPRVKRHNREIEEERQRVRRERAAAREAEEERRREAEREAERKEEEARRAEERRRAEEARRRREAEERYRSLQEELRTLCRPYIRVFGDNHTHKNKRSKSKHKSQKSTSNATPVSTVMPGEDVERVVQHLNTEGLEAMVQAVQEKGAGDTSEGGSTTNNTAAAAAVCSLMQGKAQEIREEKEAEKAEKQRQQEEERKKRELAKQKEKAALSKDEWSSEEMTVLSKGLEKYPAGQRDRWDRIADLIGTKTAKQVRHMTAKMKDVNASRTHALSSRDDYAQFLQKTTASATKKRKAASSEAAGTASGMSGDQEKKKAEQEQQEVEEWTKEQQKALEAGLRQFKGKDPSRWQKIADLVPGKDAGACQARFKYVAAMIKAKKQGKKK